MSRGTCTREGSGPPREFSRTRRRAVSRFSRTPWWTTRRVYTSSIPSTGRLNRIRLAGARSGLSPAGAGAWRLGATPGRTSKGGGIFSGLPDPPYPGRVDIPNTLGGGGGPTRLIRQIGVLLVGPGVTGSVGGNFIADNCFIAGRNGNNHDDENEHGNHERDGRDRDDDNDNHGTSRCRGNSGVSNGELTRRPSGVP